MHNFNNKICFNALSVFLLFLLIFVFIFIFFLLFNCVCYVNISKNLLCRRSSKQVIEVEVTSSLFFINFSALFVGQIQWVDIYLVITVISNIDTEILFVTFLLLLHLLTSCKVNHHLHATIKFADSVKVFVKQLISHFSVYWQFELLRHSLQLFVLFHFVVVVDLHYIVFSVKKWNQTLLP